MTRQPVFYIPHGGGPCFFMDDPLGAWTGMASFLRALPERLPNAPQAILLVSAHWETEGFALTAASKPELIYDYYGFPAHTYQLQYNVPGSPRVADRAMGLLQRAGIKARVDTQRGLDHGVFIPMKVAFPDARVPLVEMSLDRGLDPSLHLAAGQALSELRDEGIVIVGSGMSFHNLRDYGRSDAGVLSSQFDQWLGEALALEGTDRTRQLERWATAPASRFAHPREEHLLPVMVAAGAAKGTGERIYNEDVLGIRISGFQFS